MAVTPRTIARAPKSHDIDPRIRLHIDQTSDLLNSLILSGGMILTGQGSYVIGIDGVPLPDILTGLTGFF